MSDSSKIISDVDVTPAMIEAGTEALVLSRDTEGNADPDEETAVAVFTAMMQAAKLAPPSRLDNGTACFPLKW